MNQKNECEDYKVHLLLIAEEGKRHYCVDFESILVPEDNEKQNLDESYTNNISKTCCLELSPQSSMCL